MPPDGHTLVQQRRRALVIDDSPATRGYLERFLATRGYDVALAESAEDGAAQALESPPDLILSDMEMGGLSGVQLCRLLRGDPATRDIPIVLLSATLTKLRRFWALESGASMVLEKSAVNELGLVLAPLVEQDAVARRRRQASEHTRPRSRESVRASDIPVRMGHLLDETLLRAVFAQQLRGAALASSVTSLFHELAELMHRVMDLHWLALSTRRGHDGAGIVALREGNDDGVAEARTALDWIDEKGRPVMQVCVDDRYSNRATAPHPRNVRVHSIELGGVQVGRLAARLSGEREQADLLGLVASELAPILQAVVSNEEARRAAATDALTGAWNRRHALAMLEHHAELAVRHGISFSVAILDLDHFKAINDEHGHDVGDLALLHIVRLLNRVVRRTDIVARWGGEEFLQILPACEKSAARLAVERARVLIAESPLRLPGGDSLPITTSIGVAQWKAEESVMDLLRRADEALYNAKHSGRNRVGISVV